MTFANQVAIITGAGEGIGDEISRSLALQGASVILNNINAAQVITTVRWSPNQTLLIRSFTAHFGDEEQQGTQVIGWDPHSRQIRTCIFHSDGSFGQGTVSKHEQAWMLKMSQTLSDGRTAARTQVITRVDDDTITVQVIGESIDGELLPTADPVTVVRTVEASGNATGGAANEEGAKP